jgi:hypothetical protein
MHRTGGRAVFSMRRGNPDISGFRYPQFVVHPLALSFIHLFLQRRGQVIRPSADLQGIRGMNRQNPIRRYKDNNTFRA